MAELQQKLEDLQNHKSRLLKINEALTENIQNS
jgi:hypothetical protein